MQGDTAPAARPEPNQQKPLAAGAAGSPQPEANQPKAPAARDAGLAQPKPAARPEPNQQKPLAAGAAGSPQPEANRPKAPAARDAGPAQPKQVSASARELPPVSSSQPSAEQQKTVARLKEEAGSRPESDVIAMLMESSQEKMDMIRSLMDAQLEALRSAEASIASAAGRVRDDRLALLREHDSMQEALVAERAEIARHRAALKEEREDVQLRLHELKRREKLGVTLENPFRADDKAVESQSPADSVLGAPLANNGRSQQEEAGTPRRSSFNPFTSMMHVQAEKKNEDTEPDDIEVELDASSIRGGPHVVVIGGYNDICLETFGVMAVSSDGTISPFKGEPTGMRYPRQLHAAAMIDDRRIFVAGGADANGVTNTTEVLDLESMNFHRGPKMRTRRQGCAMVSIDPYRMLVIGGFDGSTSLPTTEVLSLASMSFMPGPKMNSARWGCAAVKIDGNRILVIGGRVGNWSLQTTEVLDCATMTFSPGPRLGTRRQGCAAVSLSNRRVLVIGGREGASVFFTTEELDLDTMRFKPGPRLQVKRTFCAAVALDAGRSVLVLGGADSSNTILDSTELLREGKSGFENGPDLLVPRSCLVAALAPAIPPGPAEEKTASDMRSDLIQKCFELCVPDKEQMREVDLRRFARAAGLNKDKADELGKDFKTFLRDYQQEEEGYLLLEQFAELVDNQGDVLYCSSHALSAALQGLHTEAGITVFMPNF